MKRKKKKDASNFFFLSQGDGCDPSLAMFDNFSYASLGENGEGSFDFGDGGGMKSSGSFYFFIFFFIFFFFLIAILMPLNRQALLLRPWRIWPGRQQRIEVRRKAISKIRITKK